MTSTKIRPGPKISLPQKIGDIARSALYANKPDNWILGESPGDDFGYDFLVTAFDPTSQEAQCAFQIQLKGTTQQKARLQNKNVLSYGFNRSTLNLWHRSGFAVIVAIVDLVDTTDQKEASVCYHLANYDLQDILPSLPVDQDVVFLHVPRNQVVHKDLDILPLILPYLDEIGYGQQLARERRRAEGSLSPDIIISKRANSEDGNSLDYEVTSDEVEVLIAASAHKVVLQAALVALRAGEYDQVLEICPDPTKESSETEAKDTAISAYLRSLAFDAIGDSDSAQTQITLALSLQPNCDDIVAAASHQRLKAIEPGDISTSLLVDLLRELEGFSGLSVSIVKAKLHALLGDFESARKTLAPFPYHKIAIDEIVVSVVEQAWDKVLDGVDTAKEISTLRPKQRLWLDGLAARAHFELALKDVERPESGDFIIPSTGFPQIDYERLRLAYQVSKRAMQAAQRLNWPTDIKYILDIYPISATILGYSTEAMPLLASLGLTRASVTAIREVVSKMAVQLDQPEIVLQLARNKGDSAEFQDELSIVAMAYLKANLVDKALEIATDHYLSNSNSTDIYLTTLLSLGIAASSTLNHQLVEKIRSRLASDDGEAKHYLAILNSAIMVQQNFLQRFDAISELHSYWSDNAHPPVLGFHLLLNINPTIEKEAKFFVEIAEELELHSSLSSDALADYGQALLALGRTHEAVLKLRSALARFNENPKLRSILGVALEANGQSSEAFEIFEQLLDEGKASETARRYFVEIATRMGFFEVAEKQVRAAYSKAESREHKLKLLNTLFQLLLAEGNNPQQLEEVAWEYGRLANQSDEREEGIFLQEYLVATLRENLIISEERIDEFRHRLDAYNLKFPDSSFLWRAEIPSEGPPEAILTALNEAIGLTDEDIENAKATERKMDRGSLQVPFSWRPCGFLKNISDVFMLWEVRKDAPIERAALHFSSNVAGYSRKQPQDVGASDAVLSLTSLLLLDELNLLELVLNTFPRLIIARSTLVTLQNARNTFTGGWGGDKATRIIEQLQRQFSKISHPPYHSEELKRGFPAWYYEEKKAVEQQNTFYFSDDIVETFLVCGPFDQAKSSMSTIDFLTWADQQAGIITPSKVADIIGQMTSLKVMALNVEMRYFIASIPQSLNEATSKEQAEVILQSANTYNFILKAVWHHFKPFEELLSHFSTIMSYLLEKGKANDEVLISLWLHWIGTVRFQTKPNIPLITKITHAFLRILSRLDTPEETVSKLWQSYWSALGRGLGVDLNAAEDYVGIENVAILLGSLRAQVEHETLATTLFEKAKLGLVPGTQLEGLFSSRYVDSMAKKVIENQK